jgi:autotransporter passenger strand-loop-strand repeat protein
LSQVYGNEFVSSGGEAYGDTVHRGGVLTVSSGGSVSGGLTLSGGGTAIISGSVAAGQVVLFSGAGDLALSNLSNFHALIGGYSTGDEFDLGGFAHGSRETFLYTEAANLLSGRLGVHDGGLTANLTLQGNYVSSEFALSADGHGGTFVKFV